MLILLPCKYSSRRQKDLAKFQSHNANGVIQKVHTPTESFEPQDIFNKLILNHFQIFIKMINIGSSYHISRITKPWVDKTLDKSPIDT